MLPYTPVAETDIAFFDQNGYLIVRNALDAHTINSLIEAGDRLIASDRTKIALVRATCMTGFEIRLLWMMPLSR